MGVVIDHEDYAMFLMEKLAREYHKKNYPSTPYAEYRNRCIWHIYSKTVTEHPLADMEKINEKS